jgi:hypothetical protein
LGIPESATDPHGKAGKSRSAELAVTESPLTSSGAKLGIEMPQRTEGTEAGGDQVRLPGGVALKPAVTLEDLKADTEYDPEGAEELVALIRVLRHERTRPVAL